MLRRVGHLGASLLLTIVILDSNCRSVVAQNYTANQPLLAIPVSPTATFASEILSLGLVESKEQWVISIESRCPRPYYSVRLSGPALIGMQQMHHFHLNGSNIDSLKYRPAIEYPYYRQDGKGTLTNISMRPVPRNGQYSLEILHFTCRSNVSSYKTDCLGSTLSALVLNSPTHLDLKTQNNPNQVGFWGLDDTSSIPKVQTRHQPNRNIGCSTGPCDRSFFNRYNWVDEPPLLYESSESQRNFCFLGSSHSRFMYKMFNEVFQTYNMSSTNKGYHSSDLRLASRWGGLGGAHYQNTQKKNCTTMVIASGQWALSRLSVNPDKWIRQMKKIVDDIHNNSNMTIILRNVHYHSLGFTILSCPPQDWRLPYLIDVYNEKLAELAETHPAFKKEQNMFIDTNAVVGAVWDTWEDWNHVTLKVGSPEARYMLNKMSGDKSSTTSTLADYLPSGSESGLSYGMSVPGASTLQLLLFLLLSVFLVYRRMGKKNWKIHFWKWRKHVVKR